VIKIEITEALWLDARRQFTFAELAELSGLSQDDLQQLVELEALSPSNAAAETMFGADCLDLARTACRLRDDLDLDAGALALVLRLLERIRGLEAEMRALQARLPQLLL
jgi:hypothetical protein